MSIYDDQDKKRQELADIERQMQQEENEQAEMAVQMNMNRNKYLDGVAQVSIIMWAISE